MVRQVRIGASRNTPPPGPRNMSGFGGATAGQGTPEVVQSHDFPLFLGGPLAATQPIEKFLSKLDFVFQSGFFLGNLSFKVGAKPPTSSDGFPVGEGSCGHPKAGFENNF